MPMYTCEQCKQTFNTPWKLKRHKEKKTPCISREEVTKLQETIQERDDDITNLLEEMESLLNKVSGLEAKCEDLKKDNELLNIKNIEQDRCIRSKSEEILLLECTLKSKMETIETLSKNNHTVIHNTTNNTNNMTVNNTVIINGGFESKMINKRMTMRQALGGLEGVAEYIAIHALVSEKERIACYYVTDATRRNGVYINSDGEWVRDIGGEVFKTIFGKVAFEIKRSISDCNKGLLDGDIDDETVPEEIIADIRRTRSNSMAVTRNKLLQPDHGTIRKIMKDYRGKTPTQYKDVKHYVIEMNNDIN